MAKVTLTFKGGDRLKKKLGVMAKKVRKNSVKVGFLSDARYPDGTSLAMVAAIQEYGAPSVGIPPRPYFRTMVKAKSPGWGAIAAKLIKDHDFSVAQALERMGDGIAGQLRESIIALDTPALSPVTLMLRKMRSQNQTLVMSKSTVEEARRRVARGDSYSGVSIKPLEDTGFLLNHIAYKVLLP